MATYSTWNSSDKHADIALSGGDLIASLAGATSRSHRSKASVASGKYYWEVTISTFGSATHWVGIGKSTVALTTYVGKDAAGYAYYSGNGGFYNSDISGTAGDTFTGGDKIGVAFDLDAGKVWFAKNGVWQASGNPETGANPAFSGLSGTFYACNSPAQSGGGQTTNFGSSAFSYSVPSGFTSGLPYEFSITASIPTITAQGYGNFCSLPTLPTFRASLTAHDDMVHITSAEALIPAFTTYGYATVSSLAPQPGTILAGALPAIYGALYGGGIANLSLLKSTLTATGIVAVTGSLAIPLAFTFALTGSSTIKGDFAGQFSKISLSATGLTGLRGTITSNLSLSYTSTGIVGIVGNIALILSRTTDALSGAIEPHGTAAFTLNFGFGAEGSQTSFRSMVLNLKNQGLTEFLNYNFNSLAVFNGKYFGANTTGIHELTGTQDASTNIPWRIITPRFDLETDNVRKRLRHAWIGCKPSGDLTLTVIYPDGTEYAYTADSVNVLDDGIRVKFGKGIKSRYIDLELKNVANESIVLDKFRIFVEPTTKPR